VKSLQFKRPLTACGNQERMAAFHPFTIFGSE
jgi:hypothetical protein